MPGEWLWCRLGGRATYELFLICLQHHCRNCGGIFCNPCSDNTMPLPSSAKRVRVCDTCHTTLLQRYQRWPIDSFWKILRDTCPTTFLQRYQMTVSLLLSIIAWHLSHNASSTITEMTASLLLIHIAWHLSHNSSSLISVVTHHFAASMTPQFYTIRY